MKFGLLGKNIYYSKSKELFENTFKYDHTYEIIDLDSFSKELLLEYNGLNVTTPFKQKVIDYLDDVDTVAKNIGSVNCIKNFGSKLIGFNTDYVGFSKTLEKYDIKNILLLGNGGVSKTIISYANDKNIKIVVCGRNNNCDITYSELDNYDFDCIVNATKFGVVPQIDYSKIKKETLLFDLCYGEHIAFLSECKKYGHYNNNIDGMQMLREQALESYRIWGIL